MERIIGQDYDSKELAEKVLSWIICAKRRLTTSELRNALAVEDGNRELDEENLLQIKDMVSVCAGLVTIDEDSNVIRLVHYTTQEYFERSRDKWFPNADVSVAKTCITYLSFDIFETGFCLTDKDFEGRLRFNPLYDYAARNWGHHARAASVEVRELVLRFLESRAKISASSQAAMVSRGSPGYSQRVPQQVTGLHLAAYFGLPEVVITLLMNGHKPNLKDTYEQTPLSLAAANGRDVVVSLLLASDGTDVNCKDKHGRTPVSWAAEKGYEAVVKQLLIKDGIDPDSKDRYDQTPLTWAEANGHAAVVNLLYAKDYGSSTLKNASQGSALLSRAAKDGNEAAVKILLRDIHPILKDDSGRTPLSWAAEKGHEAVVKLLLAMDNVDANLKDEYGRTALTLAAMYGHEAIIKLLLEAGGVDLNCKDKDSITPLVQAVWGANSATVKLLLEHGARSNLKDIFGWTPLWHAACRGHKAIVELLLDIDITEANYQDSHGLTPLLCAAERGHVDVVKQFLERGIKAKLDDNDGKTQLQYAIDIIKLVFEYDKVEFSLKDEYGQILLLKAAERGHVTVAKLLLDRGVKNNLADSDSTTLYSYAEGVVRLLLEPCNIDTDSKDEFFQALLSYAAEKGHEGVVKLLLEKGAEVETKDKVYGQTPLSWAAEKGYEVVVKLLLEKGAEVETKSNSGRTPLSWAAEKGHEAVVKLLLEKGAEVETKDNSGRTPLLWAAEKGHEAVVKLLLEKGAEVETKDKVYGQTPLSWPVQKGHEAVVKLLLEKGAEVETKDNSGRTPLSWAVEKGHEAVAKLLLEKGAKKP